MKTLLTVIALMLSVALSAQEIKIGNQVWLQKNLNVGVMIPNTQNQANNGIIEKWCYNNDTNMCNIYGGLYQWAEMVQYLDGVTNATHFSSPPIEGVQGICPEGWHIPRLNEFVTLFKALGDSDVAGGKMKETGTDHWGNKSLPKKWQYNINATNESGFTSLPGGCAINGTSKMVNETASFWTLTKGTLPRAAYFIGNVTYFGKIALGENNKLTGSSVRCVKD